MERERERERKKKKEKEKERHRERERERERERQRVVANAPGPHSSRPCIKYGPDLPGYFKPTRKFQAVLGELNAPAHHHLLLN